MNLIAEGLFWSFQRPKEQFYLVVRVSSGVLCTRYKHHDNVSRLVFHWQSKEKRRALLLLLMATHELRLYSTRYVLTKRIVLLTNALFSVLEITRDYDIIHVSKHSFWIMQKHIDNIKIMVDFIFQSIYAHANSFS